MLKNTKEAPPREQKPIGRRSLVKGAAWVAPVVSMSVAAPALAASPSDCVASTDVTPGIESEPITPAYNSKPNHRAGGAGYTAYQFRLGEEYVIETTGTFTYNGTSPVPLSAVSMRVWGTNSLYWTLEGTPEVSSSSGGIQLGSFGPSPGQPQDHGWTDIQLAATSTGDGYLHPGETVTFTWRFRTTGSVNTSLPSTGSAWAYPGFYIDTCSGWSAPYPTQAWLPCSIYQFVNG
ncbi:hypothetical protein [Brachybacterium hainanense]|uniref:Secreted protein n=1 Tax=Brachybacterium hainanense TaxID=1541174 RepID=A0ABV6R9Y9_9MICO